MLAEQLLGFTFQHLDSDRREVCLSLPFGQRMPARNPLAHSAKQRCAALAGMDDDCEAHLLSAPRACLRELLDQHSWEGAISAFKQKDLNAVAHERVGFDIVLHHCNNSFNSAQGS